MPEDKALLEALRAALAELDRAESERARAWAWSGSGLLEPTERRGAQMEAEREVEEAQERLRKARSALPSTTGNERSWSAH